MTLQEVIESRLVRQHARIAEIRHLMADADAAQTRGAAASVERALAPAALTEGPNETAFREFANARRLREAAIDLALANLRENLS